MKYFFIFTFLMTLQACDSITPWVKPYEREILAKPIMNPNHNVATEQFRNHVYDTRSASKGATSTQGGGCGCN